jgi:hypothetical protein
MENIYESPGSRVGISSVNIVLYDISGAPIEPDIRNELISKAEELAKRSSLLAINVAEG